jgi:GNAT superfamily N-acetyltransferase
MRIELIDDPKEDLQESVKSVLRHHNQSSNPVWWEKTDQPENDARPLNLFAFSPDGDVVGGLFATTRFLWLKIDIMTTRVDRRGSGIGRGLLAKAETVAMDRGCKYAYVETMEYQAPRFYSKAGYTTVGTLDDWDSHGHKKFLFVKNLG